MINLETAVLGNAAGFVKTHEQARVLLAVPTVTRITIGSVKLDPWPGNSGETYYYDAETKTGYNSKGLDTSGLDALMEWLPAFHEECKQAGKELVVSIAATTPQEYATMAERIAPHCDLIEVNAGCGNVWGPKGQKPIPSYEPELLAMILFQVSRAVGKPMLTVKLSPVERPLIEPLARVLDHYPYLVEAICCNTKILQEGWRPNGAPALAFLEPGGTEVKHKGGRSGKPQKPESMRVLEQLIGLVPRLRYIGCGGGDSGRDLLDYMELGAVGMEVGTEFGERGPRIFEEIVTQADKLLEEA